jgi:hypothetical protein
MRTVPDALAPLAAYRQWIVYTLVPSNTRPGKNDKFPVDYRTGHKVDAHDSAAWTDAQTAIATAAAWGHPYGVGFVFTEADPFWFLDIDNCAQFDEAGQFKAWSPVASMFLQAFPGVAVEVSSSGKGLHLIGTGKAPQHAKKNVALSLEFYTEKRFVALTGTSAQGSAATNHEQYLPWLVQNYFPPRTIGEPVEWSSGPCDGWNGPTDDDELLRRALRSGSAEAAFGNKASFADLFDCNVEVLARAYPDGEGGRAYDGNRVDMALAQHLAFWTGKDCARIERMMRRSKLARPKWDEHPTYLRELTITNAVGMQSEVLSDKLPEPVNPLGGGAVDGEAAKAEIVTGATYLSPTQQLDTFKGCVYVVDSHRVLVPGGLLLKSEQFRVVYGGYTLMLDNGNEKTTRDAFEAFTQNQAYRAPRANTTCFKPQRASGEVIKEAGFSRVNTYWPIEVPRMVGDITPFANHLAKLLPNERDRLITLSYMAACVQYKGYKFQWAPVLQGVEGNGKTLLSTCTAEAIGKRYVHWPKANKLCAQFNGWMRGNILYCVEDIYVPSSRIEIIEELKPMITGKELEIEGKGIDVVTADVCGNFILNSNHKAAIPKTRNDRRFCNLFTAQQQHEDLARDGMVGDYFPKLYSWFYAEGAAIINEFLHTFPIPDEFNPATTCQRAPVTTSTELAIVESLGSVEQEILEAVAQEKTGFSGGWISSSALDALINDMGARRRLPLNRRTELMKSLGYVTHPGLKDGRSPVNIMMDGTKPILYIRTDHRDRVLTDPVAIVAAYTEAQTGFRRATA